MDIKLKVAEILNENQFDEIYWFQVNNEEDLRLFNIVVNKNIERYFLSKLLENEKEVLWISLSVEGNITEKELFTKIIILKSNLFKILILESIKRGNFHFSKDKLTKLTESVNNWTPDLNDPVYLWLFNSISKY
jgi:hypothetical protein